MIPGLLLLVSHSTALPQIGYVARYYSPPDSAKETTYQVYVADIDGRNRRQLTNLKGRMSDVRWLGHTKLAFIQNIDNLHQLWSIDSTGKNLKLISKGPVVSVAENRPLQDERGKPIYLINSEARQFNGTKWVATEIPLNNIYPPDSGPWKLQTNDDARPFTIVTEPMKILDGPPSTMECQLGGKTFTTACYGIPTKMVFTKNPNIGYLSFFQHNSTNGTSYTITRVDFSTGKGTLQAQGFGDLDFWPGSALYAGVTPRDLVPYGKKTVWGTTIQVGKPGLKGTTVVKGLVACQSVALQP